MPIPQTLLSQSSPLRLPPLPKTVLWYAARLESGLASTDPVVTATDWSRNGNHATQATGSKRPTFVANAINGLPAFRFDPTDDYLGFTTWAGGNPLPQPVTFTVLFKSVAGTRLIVDSDAWTSNNRMAIFTESGNFLQYGFTLNLSAAYATGPYTIVNALFSGAASSFYLDDVLKASGTLDTGGLYGLTLGNEAGKAFPLGGDVAEVVINQAILRSEERYRLNRYLAAIYDRRVS